MKTVLTRSPIEAARFVQQGGIVAFPTETVYGLGADVFSEAAIWRIFEAKNRPADNPLIAHVNTIGQIKQLVAEIPGHAQKLVDAFFPGPLTIVLRKSANVPYLATAGLETIGIRMPKLALAQEFLGTCGVPVVAPSANLSGRPSPTTWEAVLEDLDGRIDCILQGDATQIGLESTVVDCTSERPSVLRQGAVAIETLREIVPEVSYSAPTDSEAPRSPGLKHKHYSPRAAVVIVAAETGFSPTDRNAFIGMQQPDSRVKVVRICNSVDEYAASLFEFFRECDRAGVETIFCEAVEEKGIGAALMDRIRRASES